MDRIEIQVSRKELEQIKSNRKDAEKRLFDVDGLKTTLLALKYRLLVEQEERLRRKLEEMVVHYRELLEFQERVKKDKEFLLRLRRELSEENKVLREKLGERR